MNTPVNSKLAKLLKENGFEYQYQWNPSFDNLPTISDVVMWLYEKYKIWISVQQEYTDSLDFSYRLKEKDGLTPPIGCYKTSTESYEKAIEYCLLNLI